MTEKFMTDKCFEAIIRDVRDRRVAKNPEDWEEDGPDDRDACDFIHDETDRGQYEGTKEIFEEALSNLKILGDAIVYVNKDGRIRWKMTPEGK